MARAMDKIEACLVGSSVERDLVVMQIGKLGRTVGSLEGNEGTGGSIVVGMMERNKEVIAGEKGIVRRCWLDDGKYLLEELCGVDTPKGNNNQGSKRVTMPSMRR